MTIVPAFTYSAKLFSLSGTFGPTCLTQRLMRLLNMENFFLAMYDCPDALHQLMAFLRDNCLRIMRWAQAGGPEPSDPPVGAAGVRRRKHEDGAGRQCQCETAPLRSRLGAERLVPVTYFFAFVLG